MTGPADRAVAIVGVGAILPDAPDVADVLGQRHATAATASATSTRALGSRRSTTTPIRRRPTRRTRRSAAGCATGTGTRSPGSCRSRRASATRWTTGRSGRSPARARRSPTTAGRSARSTSSAPRSILGNAMAGEKHYLTTLRITFPEFARELERAPSFAALPADAPRGDRSASCTPASADRLPDITEDTMPGELANCIAGRVANLFNLRGPELRRRRRLRVGDGRDERRRSRAWSTGDFDAVVTGGIDRNMGASIVRQVLQDRRALGAPARGPTPTAPTAS